MRVAIFKQPPRAQFLTKSKNFCAHQIENYLEIILGFEIFEKGHPSLSYRRSKFGDKLWYFLPRFYTNPSLFLAFTVFTSIVYFFWSFPYNSKLFELDTWISQLVLAYLAYILSSTWISQKYFFLSGSPLTSKTHILRLFSILRLSSVAGLSVLRRLIMIIVMIKLWYSDDNDNDIVMIMIPSDPLVPLPGVLTWEVARGVAAVVGDRKPVVLKIKNIYSRKLFAITIYSC